MSANADLHPFLVHGGRVAEARARFGGEEWIDLSTGIAPWAWAVGGRDLKLDRLPEPGEIAELEAAARDTLRPDGGVEVVAVPGTDLALRLLAVVIGAEAPGVVQPGFGGHRSAWPRAVPIGHDELEAAADRCDLVVLASPANPDGRTLAPERLRALTAKTRVVLDEAYADPAPVPTGLPSDRLIVLRSFGKFFGLPGVRLGFVLAAPDTADALRRLLGDWPVSGPAVSIGRAAYRDATWRSAQAQRIAEAGARLDALLHGAALDVVGRAPLFRLVRTGDARGLFRTLARHAILTRPFADEPDWLRLGLPAGDAECARLSLALQEFRP